MIHVAEKNGFSLLYDKDEGVVKMFLNLHDKEFAMTAVDEMKRRRLSAPICI